MQIRGGESPDASGPLRVLLIEDDARDVVLLRELIREETHAVDLVNATSVESARPHLVDDTIDVILLDLNLPDLCGLEAVAAVHAGSLGQPIVVLTGRAEGDLAVEALRMGAQDYLLKEALEPSVLVRAIQHAIERQRLLTCMRHSVHSTNADREDLRRLLLQGTEALLVVDTDRRVQFANHLAEHMFGSSLRQLKESPFVPPVIPGAELEHEIVRPDGSRILVEIRSVHVLWRERDALLVSLRDISERRRAAEQQVRIELLTSFLNSMSHELRTPLSAVYQFVSNVRDGIFGPLNREQQEQLSAALRNVDESLAMVANLLEIARVDGGKLRVDLRVMCLEEELGSLCEVLSTSAKLAGLRFETELAHDLPHVFADPARVRQIIANLVENAIKFTPAGGRIRLEARGDLESGRIVLAVSDTGCGVPPEHLERIFDQLHQVPDQVYRTRRGLGLGLHITRELVRALGGEIRVESAVGQGSRFEVLLPVFSWEDVVRTAFEAQPAESPLSAIVVRVAWPDEADGEPIPAGPIALVSALVRTSLDEQSPAIIPPIVTGSAMRTGAVVSAPPNEVEALLARMREAFDSEPMLTGSTLVVEPEVTSLRPANSVDGIHEVSDRLSRCFLHSSSGGLRCSNPT